MQVLQVDQSVEQVRWQRCQLVVFRIVFCFGYVGEYTLAYVAIFKFQVFAESQIDFLQVGESCEVAWFERPEAFVRQMQRAVYGCEMGCGDVLASCDVRHCRRAYEKAHTTM